MTVVTLNGLEHVDCEQSAQLRELRSHKKHLVTRGSVPFDEFPIRPLGQLGPLLAVHQLSTLPARSPRACPSGEHRKAVDQEIRARIDGEHGRRLAEIAMVAAEIDARDESHTSGGRRPCSAQPDRIGRLHPPHKHGLKGIPQLRNNERSVPAIIVRWQEESRRCASDSAKGLGH